MNKVQKWIANNLLGFKASSLPAGAMVPTSGPGRFVEVNGTVTWISDNLAAYVKDGYQTNDIVYAAISLIMDKVRCAPWGLYSIQDESSLKRYRGMISGKYEAKDWTEARRLRKKALVEIENPTKKLAKLASLLQWANERTTFNDLVAEHIAYKLVTGNGYTWANLIEAGANQGVPQELFNMPSQYIMLIIQNGWPQRIVGYELLNGFYDTFPAEAVMHTKYWNPEFNVNGSGLYGMSPLKPGGRTVTRNNSSKQAGAVQLQNNGTAGIAYIDDALVPAAGRESQIGLVKDKWNSEYTGAQNFGKVAFSGYKMGYVPVGTALKDMDLTNIEVSDLRNIFNLWGIPSQLGNDPDNKTYNSQKEAEKALTTRCALPNLIAFRDMFNKMLKVWGFPTDNVYVDFDMTIYSELQEDQAQKWTWVNTLPISSRSKLELMDLDAPDDPNLDVILVPNNMTTLEEVTGNLSDTAMQAINDRLNAAGLNDYQDDDEEEEGNTGTPTEQDGED